MVKIEGRANVSAFLLQHGAHVNAPDTYGTTPLAAAARHGHASVVSKEIACVRRLECRVLLQMLLNDNTHKHAPH